MEKLLAALAEKGIRLTGCSDAEICKVAKGVGLDPDHFLPRALIVERYTNKRKETNVFAKTPSFVVGTNENGKPKKVRGLYLRVDALDQAIEDLTELREMYHRGEITEREAPSD